MKEIGINDGENRIRAAYKMFIAKGVNDYGTYKKRLETV